MKTKSPRQICANLRLGMTLCFMAVLSCALASSKVDAAELLPRDDSSYSVRIDMTEIPNNPFFAFYFNPHPGQIDVNLGKTVGGAITGCDYRNSIITNVVVPSWEITKNGGQNEHMARLLQEVERLCAFPKKEVDKYKISGVTVLYYPSQCKTPGGSDCSVVEWAMRSPIEKPKTCRSTLSGDMAFGPVKRGSRPQAASTVNVSCDGEANVRVTVNGSKPYQDERTGTLISFGGVTALPCSGLCSVPINGVMESTPSSPGVYSWSVPIVVEYE